MAKSSNNIVAVILFESDEEMKAWLLDKSQLDRLKQEYNPKSHQCLLNKETRQLTILKGRM